MEIGRTRADFEAIYGWIRWKGRFVKRFNSCRTPTALWRGVYYRFSPSNSDAMLVQPRGKRLIRNPSNSFAHVKPHKTPSLAPVYTYGFSKISISRFFMENFIARPPSTSY